MDRVTDLVDSLGEACLRVLLMELNRLSSHLVCIATGGMEIGALTVMPIGFRERELVLRAHGRLVEQPVHLDHVLVRRVLASNIQPRIM